MPTPTPTVPGASGPPFNVTLGEGGTGFGGRGLTFRLRVVGGPGRKSTSASMIPAITAAARRPTLVQFTIWRVLACFSIASFSAATPAASGHCGVSVEQLTRSAYQAAETIAPVAKTTSDERKKIPRPTSPFWN